MNNIERAFLSGFIKAGIDFTSAPKPNIPQIQMPKTPSMSSVNSIPSSTKLSPPKMIGGNIPLNVSSAPNNYSVDGMPDSYRKFNVNTPNTLNIDAHGGSASDGYGFKQDPKYRSPGYIAPKNDHPFNNLQDYLKHKIEENGKIFSIGDVAKNMGQSTNSINNLYSLACNAGDGRCATNINPNRIVGGYATPAYYKKYFPNLTNVVMTPPGNYGILNPNNGSNISPLSNITQVLKYNTRNALLNILDKGGLDGSLPHQYGLENGTNWVDKGPYYKY